jgi:hypothetical protein
MRTKLISLALLVIFAVLVTSVVVFCPVGHTVERSIDSVAFSSVVYLNSEAVYEPQGMPIDDPAMPT